MIDLSKPVQIAEGLWWVGSESTHRNLQCNPYLYTHEGWGILFDPGSKLDGRIVLEKTMSLIDIDHLQAIVLSHQDPDLASAVPYFEEAGFKGEVCCHERTSLILQYYGFHSPFYLVNYHSFSYTLKSGAAIGFLFTPYLHFPGAIMSYLPQVQALMTGDVFGSITADWHLYAGESYLDGMKAFHEVYMPSHEILSSAMESLQSYPLRLICPQHGSIINKNLEMYIDTLKTLSCGLFLEPKELALPSEGGIRALLDQVVVRLITIHGTKEVAQRFRNAPFTISVKNQCIAKSTLGEEQLWDTFFTFLEEHDGMEFLSSISSLVERLVKEYDLAMPKAFASLLFRTQKTAKESQAQLQELEQKVKQLEESKYRDPITGLYNQTFHEAFLSQQLKEHKHFVSVVLSIDNLNRINLDFGISEGDKTMRLLSELLLAQVDADVQVCRLSGGVFALVCSNLAKEQAIKRASNIMMRIAEENRFIIPITVSMGLFSSDELPASLQDDVEQSVLTVSQTTLFRLKLAQKQGGGVLVSTSSSHTSSRSAITVLLVDKAGFDRELLKQSLEQERYRVLTADDGLQAKEMIASGAPDIIIAELLIAKLSALTLRKELMNTAATARIPFILMSINKNEQSVKRAYTLGIKHFLRRPVPLYEVVGLVNLLSEKGV
ncbi:diguanylate cyclase [Sphaerochaeta sp.]|uniref:diguanylate cyclase n=1 Tax=Sphaerochaeta sp. TaxID=1972642 RepID=UPI002FCB7D07